MYQYFIAHIKAKQLQYLAISAILIPFFTACAEPNIVYKEVKVPIKCDVKERARPAKNANALVYLKEVLIYAEGLERDLAYCKGKSK